MFAYFTVSREDNLSFTGEEKSLLLKDRWALSHKFPKEFVASNSEKSAEKNTHSKKGMK